MAISELLRLVIDADTQGAVRGIETVGRTADREFTKAEKSMDRWGSGLTKVGAAMVGVGAAALVGLGKAAMASEDANLATVKLENTLRNMPKLAGENSKQFVTLAEGIQDVTAADADAVIEGQALLGTFQLTAQEIKGITPLVVDYARKFGADIPNAAIQVGKALDGQIGALKRNGVSIDENLFKTDRYAAVTQALRDQVGGFAEEEGKTFAGSLARLKNEMGDLVEGVGSGAVDAFTSMFGAVDGLVDRFKDLSPETQNAIGKVATFGSVALIAAGSVSMIIGQLLKMQHNFTLARVAVAEFAGSGGLGRLARVSLVVGGFIALREVLQALDNDLEGIDVSTLENQLLDLAETGKFTGGQLEKVMDGFREAVESGDPQALEAWADQLGEVDKALAQLAARDPEAAAAAFRAISSALREQGASAEQVKRFFDDYGAAVVQADTASRTGAEGVGELGGAMDDTAGSTSVAQQALKDYSDALNALFDPLFGATDALLDNQEAQAKVWEASLALAGAERDHGAASDEARKAQEELTAAHRNAGKSALDVDLAFRELNAAVADNPGLLADAQRSIQGWVTQGLISEATAAEMARQFDITAGAARNMGDTDPVVNVSVTGVDFVLGKLADVAAYMRSIPSTKTVSIVGSVSGGFYPSTGGATGGIVTAQGIRGYASGGIAASDTVPAWLTPGEMILNGPQQSRLFSALNGGGSWAGGPSTVINVNVAGSIWSERELFSTLNRGMDRGMRLGRNGASL